MPLSPPRRSLGVEIALSLAVKAAALAALSIFLFGPDDRVEATPETVADVLVGEKP